MNSLSILDEYVFEAETQEEALKKALEELSASVDDLDIKLLSEGSKGFLGIGKKRVKISVKFKEQNNVIPHITSQPNITEQPDGAVNQEVFDKSAGWVQIKDGKVSVGDPISSSNRPVLVPGGNVEILVNGQKITSPKYVKNEDEIIIKPLNIEATLNIEVSVSKDRMKALLNITRTVGEIFAIADEGPVFLLKTSAKCVKKEVPSIEYEQILEALHSNKVVYGINESAIREALASDENDIEIEVATGLKPTENEGNIISYTFNTQNSNQEKASYFEENVILSVSEGEVMAVRKPGEEKKPGIDVTGQSVLPTPTVDKVILVGKGVTLSEDGNVAMATIQGRPVLEGKVRKVLSVQAIHYIKSSDSNEPMKMQFKGDIVVKGNLKSGSELKAGGEIIVLGDIELAALYAERSISASKKVFSANLHAGISELDFKLIAPELNQLLDLLRNLFDAVKILKKEATSGAAETQIKGDGQIIQLLIDYKYKDIPLTIHKMLKSMSDAKKELAPEIIEIVKMLDQKLCNLGPLKFSSDKELETLIQKLDSTVELIKNLSFNTANIEIGYAQNSSLHASGDIKVTGAGCITTDFDAGGNIIIERGNIRGGKLSAKGNIKLHIIGSTNGAEIIVRLHNKTVFSATEAYPPITFEYLTQKVVIDKQCKQLKAYVDKEGYLVTQSLKG